MRNLTICRKKSFVACLAKMKVYIEDHAAAELMINNVPCRKLGDLKNGETKTFWIGDQAARVYVIGDKLSRHYSNEFFELPEGQENIFLSGKNKYNLASGNPFRFDNNSSAAVVANRKKGVRIGLIVLAVAAVVGFGIGFITNSGLLSHDVVSEKTFSHEGMRITLTDEFISTKQANFDFTYATEDVVVVGLKEAFEDYPQLESYTQTQYANAVITNNGLKYASVQQKNGMVFFDYDATSGGSKEEYHYIAYVFRTDEAMWMIQFATLKTDAAQYADQIDQWAQTITFEN